MHGKSIASSAAMSGGDYVSVEISRDPSDYRPSDHCKQRVRYRGIAWDDVSETIQHGEVYPSRRDDCYACVKHFDHLQHPVKVVVNPVQGVVITAVKAYEKRDPRIHTDE